jgi:hypothetical protein
MSVCKEKNHFRTTFLPSGRDVAAESVMLCKYSLPVTITPPASETAAITKKFL